MGNDSNQPVLEVNENQDLSGEGSAGKHEPAMVRLPLRRVTRLLDAMVEGGRSESDEPTINVEECRVDALLWAMEVAVGGRARR